MRIEQQLPPEFDLPPDVLACRRAQVAAAVSRPRRSGRLVAGGVPALGAVGLLALALAFAWPFGGRGGVLDRALAALGNGPVVHVVRQGDWGGSVVDLSTGAKRALPGIDEDWYDTARGLQRHVARLGGAVQQDSTFRPRRAPADIVGLATRYREALTNGSAVVASRGNVDGVPVDWIKVRSEMLPDVADHKLHEWAQEVAVSRETYQPVATRETRDGEPGPGGLSRILTLEYVSASAAQFELSNNEPGGSGPFSFSPGFGSELTLPQARDVLPGRLLWAGEQLGGLALAHVGKLEYASGYDRQSGTWASRLEGVMLAYGHLTGIDQGHPTLEGPYILVRETPGRPVAGVASSAYTPPAGAAFVSHGTAVVIRDGVYVEIQAPSDEGALAAARSLKPVSAGSAARR